MIARLKRTLRLAKVQPCPLILPSVSSALVREMKKIGPDNKRHQDFSKEILMIYREGNGTSLICWRKRASREAVWDGTHLKWVLTFLWNSKK